MSLTGKDVAEIARLLDASPFSSLDLTMGDFRLRIRRDGGLSARDDDEPEHPPRVPAQAGTSGNDERGPRLRGASGISAREAAEGEVDIPAPLLGNFYTAPRPGDPPFVAIGDTVGEDTTIGIIEVMKLMNPIRAGVSGTVTAILAENGTAVEEGQPLVRVRVD